VFIVRSLHGADAVLLVLRSAATLLVALVLPTPGGSGGLEGLYALFIGPLMPQALMAPTLLLWRLLDYYLFIALGAYLFLDLMRTAPPPAVPDGRAVRGGGSAEQGELGDIGPRRAVLVRPGPAGPCLSSKKLGYFQALQVCRDVTTAHSCRAAGCLIVIVSIRPFVRRGRPRF